jgi:hypothetical protein
MLLRRIIAHFRKQEWTAIGIDFLIVVLGVFIGIQVADLNTSRQERELGDFYLQRIADDVRNDVAALENNIRAWREEARQAEIIIDYLRDGDLRGRTEWEMFARIYYDAGWIPFVPNTTAYEELRSTSQLRLIDNPDLRLDIGAYYATLAEFRPFYAFDTPLREAVRSKYPPGPQRYFWATCFSEENYRQSRDGRTNCPPFEDRAVVTRTLSTLRSDADLLEAMQYTVAIRLVAIESAATDLARANELVARMEDHLR